MARRGGARTRQCLVTRACLEPAALIRFVVSPEGEIVPDLAAKLPGRGLWVSADAGSVDKAARRNLFARAARAPVRVSEDLAAIVEARLGARVLDFIGLAARAGDVAAGFVAVCAALKAGAPAVLLEARDGRPDGRRKLAGRLRGAPLLIGCFTADELGLALGRESVVHAALKPGRPAERVMDEARRLSGFRPLVPPDWAQLSAGP